MRIVFIGPPGAGKGTQGAVLAQHLAVSHLVVGDLLRSAIAARSPVGERARSAMDRGALVDDDIVDALVAPAVEATSAGFVLDGYPRTVEQAETLDRLLDRSHVKVDLAVRFVVPDDELVRRLLARGRSDDTLDVVRARLSVYSRAEQALTDHYADRLVEFDAVGEVQALQSKLLHRVTSGSVATSAHGE